MAKIVWDDSFSVGIRKLDNEHKMLIGMINKLHESGQAQGNDEVVTDLITEMTDYFHYHFATEEHYMRKYHYPDYARHCAEHEEFIERVIAFCSEDLSQSKKIVAEMADYLGEWLINHVLVTDMKYTSFFHAKGLR